MTRVTEAVKVIKAAKLLSILCLLIALTACGFTLRGSGSAPVLPEQLQTMQVLGTDGNSELLRLVRRNLSSSGVNVLDSSDQLTSYILRVGREQIQERIISVNGNARAGEYEISMTVIIDLISQTGGEGLAAEPFIVEKVYLADSNNAVAKNEEAELIQSEMRRELVNQIMRRLQRIELEVLN